MQVGWRVDGVAPRASDAAAATAIPTQALEKELAQKVRPVLQSVGCPAPAIDRAVPKLLRNWPQILEALESSILAHYDDLPPKAQISYYFLHPFGAYFPSAEQKEFVEDYAQHVSEPICVGAISASRGAAAPLRHRGDSCPSHNEVGGFSILRRFGPCRCSAQGTSCRS